jgi:hypothetical protein
MIHFQTLMTKAISMTNDKQKPDCRRAPGALASRRRILEQAAVTAALPGTDRWMFDVRYSRISAR